MTSEPVLQFWAMSWSIALPQSGSGLISMASDTIKGHSDAGGLGHHLRLCRCLRVMPPLEPCQSEGPSLPPWAKVTSEPRLLIGTMSGSVNTPGSGPQSVIMLVSEGCAATGTCQSGWPMLLGGPLVMSRPKLLPRATGVCDEVRDPCFQKGS